MILRSSICQSGRLKHLSSIILETASKTFIGENLSGNKNF